MSISGNIATVETVKAEAIQYDHHQHHHRDNHQGGNTKPRGDEDWNHSEVNFVHTPSKVEAYILVLGS